jgi:hypothetical protein
LMVIQAHHTHSLMDGPLVGQSWRTAWEGVPQWRSVTTHLSSLQIDATLEQEQLRLLAQRR